MAGKMLKKISAKQVPPPFTSAAGKGVVLCEGRDNIVVSEKMEE
jgi:hypothetical protein